MLCGRNSGAVLQQVWSSVSYTFLYLCKRGPTKKGAETATRRHSGNLRKQSQWLLPPCGITNRKKHQQIRPPQYRSACKGDGLELSSGRDVAESINLWPLQMHRQIGFWGCWIRLMTA